VARRLTFIACHGSVGRELVVRRVKIGKHAVLTIGHSNRTWKEFLEILRAHRVKRVIDVRSIPRSRHNPQFNRETLSTKLRAARIGYVYLRKLGGLRHTRRDSSNMGWRNASFRGFADYMQASEFEAGLLRTDEIGREEAERDDVEAVPWRCHRSLVADALTVRGIEVDHIMSMKRSRVHSLTFFAKVLDSRIIYPLDKPTGWGPRTLALSIASRYNVMVTCSCLYPRITNADICKI
jgi:uncharacterized protein (DUF488 family)